ncbi:MAG: hypothetical protein IPM33_03015 [Phycisphaerales bacterium]|nr:hypothetical protein [Phycisphaerales bacterium]
MRTAMLSVVTLILCAPLGGCVSGSSAPMVAAGPGVSAGDAFGLGMPAYERHLAAKAAHAKATSQAQASADQTPR